MSAFKEALERLATCESAEERGLQAALLDSQIDESAVDTSEIDGLKADLEKARGDVESIKADYSKLQVKYADMYFSRTVDPEPTKVDNGEKPITIKSILG